MQEAPKDIFGPLFETMLRGEMDHHLGYGSNSKDAKPTDNRRNGYGSKRVKTSYGEVNIEVPRDRDACFEPELIKKRQTDVSSIENKVLAMYIVVCLKEIFRDPTIASAILDRVLHHSHIVSITGKSYRLKHLYDLEGETE